MFRPLVQCLWGALAGYITNEYAIKHIFMDFGPVKSVVSKRRASLANSLADMVEDKLMRGEALANAVASDKTAAHLESMTLDALGGLDVKLNEIDGFDEASRELCALIAEALSDAAARAGEGGLRLGSFVKLEELDAFFEKLARAAFPNDEILISDLIPPGAFDGLKTALEQFLRSDGGLAAVYVSALTADGALAAAQRLKGRRVADFVSGGDERVKTELARLLSAFVASPGFERFVEGLFGELVNWLLKADIHPADLLPEDFGEGLRAVCVRLAGAILPEIADFIEDCDEDIGGIIERGAEHAIDAGLGGSLPKIGLVRELIIDKASSRGAVVRAVRDYIENRLGPDEIGENLASAAEAFLREKTLAEITASVMSRALPKDASAAVAAFIRKRGAALPDGLWQWFIGLEIPDLTPEARAVSRFAANGGEDIVSSAAPIASAVVNALEQALRRPVRPLAASLGRLIRTDKPLAELAADKEKTRGVLIKAASALGERRAGRAALALTRGKPVKRFARWLRDKALGENLPRLFRIREIIGQKINGMDMGALCTMVESFMGENLRPLCWLGAGFGAAAGAALGVGEMYFSVPVWVGLPVFALIGVITNILALRGLFRPYERRLFMQGFLPANKGVIAKKTAEMAERELLNPELLRAHYEASAGEMKSAAVSRIKESRGDIKDFVREHAPEWGVKAEAAFRSSPESAARAVAGQNLGGLGGVANAALKALGENPRPLADFAEEYVKNNGDRLKSLIGAFTADPEALWAALARRRLPDILPAEAASSLCGRLASASADALCRRETAAMIAARLEALLASAGEGATVGTAFGGIIPKTVSGRIGPISRRLCERLAEIAVKNREAIVDAITSAIAKKHPLVSLLIDVREIVGGILDYALENELDGFMLRRREAIERLTDRLFVAYVYPVGLDELRLRGGVKLGSALGDFLVGGQRPLTVRSALDYVYRELYRELGAKPLGEYMELLHVRTFAEADGRFNGALTAFLGSLHSAAEAAPLPEGLTDALAPAAARAVAAIAERASALAFRQELARNLRIGLDITVSDIIPEDELRRRLARAVNEIPAGDVRDLAERAISGAADVLPDRFIDGAAGPVVSAVVDALADGIGPLLADLDIAKVAEESVNSLSGREIEELFAFARPFFSSIKRWGAIGVLYGVNSYVSASVTALHFALKIVLKNRKKSVD